MSQELANKIITFLILFIALMMGFLVGSGLIHWLG